MFTYPKLTVCILHMLMLLILGHMTLLLGKIYLPEFFPESDLRHWVDSRWARPQISSWFCIDIVRLCVKVKAKSAYLL